MDLALSVEEKFNQLRWKYNVPKLRTHPNRNLNPVRKAFYAVWGGRDYGSIDMQEVLDPQRSQVSACTYYDTIFIPLLYSALCHNIV